jgi:hypothetical protein
VPPLLDAALHYQALGWSVVPLHTPTPAGCSCSKGSRCRAAGKHPRFPWRDHQHGRATAADVAAWWRSWPEANVGLVTGMVSGVAVLDVDARNGGLDTLHELDARGLWMPDDNPLAATGGRGLHHYVRLDTPLRKCAVFEGIEFQADGGLVVAPPSLHASGRRYAWVRPPGAPIPVIPTWLHRCVEMVLRPEAPPCPRPPEGAAPDDVLGAVEAAGLYVRPHRRDRWHYIRCPWAGEHSNEDPEALLIAPGAVGSDRAGWGFVCLHAHCSDRHLGALLDYLNIARRRP